MLFFLFTLIQIIIIIIIVLRNATGLHALPIRKAVVLIVDVKVGRDAHGQQGRYRERVLGQTGLGRRRRGAGADARCGRRGVVDGLQAEYALSRGRTAV